MRDEIATRVDAREKVTVTGSFDRGAKARPTRRVILFRLIEARIEFCRSLNVRFKHSGLDLASVFDLNEDSIVAGLREGVGETHLG
jgi:hypothetical protein